MLVLSTIFCKLFWHLSKLILRIYRHIIKKEEIDMTNLKEKLGAKIQEIRKAKHITQEKLAEMINMDTSNLSNIERGKKFMTSVTMEKLVKSLNITEKELFDFEHILPEDELKKQIIKKLETLSYSELKFVYKTLDNLSLINR